MADYNPSQDYAASYDALSRRISSNFASQRAGLNQELATRGVQTSGVSSIPSAALRVGENNAKDDIAGQYALEQAHTGIEDRRRAEDFANQMKFAQFGYDQTSAIARRAANAGLESALISGGLGAAGGIFAGSLAPGKKTPAPVA
jgi:hypothetical protein